MAQVKQPADKSHFILPDLGEGVHEAELIKGGSRWAIKLPNTKPLQRWKRTKRWWKSPARGRVWSPNCVVLKVTSSMWAPCWWQHGESSEAPASPAADEAEATESPASEEQDAGTVVGSVNGDGDAPSALTRRRSKRKWSPPSRCEHWPPLQFAGSPNNLALTSTASWAPDAADA